MRKHTLALSLPILMALGGLALLRADHPRRPTAEQVEQAEQTSDLLVSSLVAGLVDVFVATVPENVDQGNHAIRLVFNNRNQNIRLVGEDEPLSQSSRPRGPFERNSLNLALAGQENSRVQRLRGRWVFRRSVPLANSVAQCAVCHTNFGPPSAVDYTGALMVVVPIATADQDDD